MSNKFLCGRLIMQKDGSLKKLGLSENGGGRYCFISHIDMGFEEIHDRMRELFGFNQSNCQTKLYDFKCQLLDTNQYTTFYDYIQKHGLRFKSILLYLCTPPDGEEAVAVRSPEKRRSAQPTPSPRPIVRIPQMEADSSTPIPIIKPDVDLIPINELSVTSRSRERVRRSSFSSYSFETSLTDLVVHLRDLLHRSNGANILIQLFEDICTLRGLSSIILDRLKQNTTINESDKSICHDGLDKIEKISRSINVFIELNRMNITHLDSRSIIIQSFNEFYKNFNILRQKHQANVASPPTNHSVDPKPTTSSTHHHHHSENNSRKRTHTLSPNSYHRRTREAEAKEDNEKYSLFKALIRSLDDLLSELKHRRLTSFCYFVESTISETKSCRSNLKLSDNRSLNEAEQYLLNVERHLTNRINDEHRRAAPHKINSYLQQEFDRTLDALRDLLKTLPRYQTQHDKHKRPRTSHRSSPVEEKPMNNKSTQPKARTAPVNNNTEDDESSEASHSSVGDEVLMEVARGAYESKPNRPK